MAGRIDLKDIPTYTDFFDDPDLSNYEQIHVHLQTLRRKKKKTFFDPSYKVEVSTIGKDQVDETASITDSKAQSTTGSTSFFPIGKYTFEKIEDHHEPSWDKKGMILGKKDSIESICFRLYNGKSVISTFYVPRSDYKVDEDWVQGKSHDAKLGITLSYRIRVGSKRIVSKDDFDRIFTKDPNIVYDHKILKDEESTDASDWAWLQCFKQKEAKTRKAVLWIPGRNDGFMHPHVYYGLFNESGYDLYVLNYRSTSQCLNRGWVKDPAFSSHNKEGDFNIYIADIERALASMKSLDGREYEKKLGYAHSTGGPVLINYLIEKGDTAFNGFIFNAPLMDFGGAVMEFAADVVSYLTGNIRRYISPMSMDFKMPMKLPVPVTYTLPSNEDLSPNDSESKSDVKISDWSSKIYSLYYWETGVRPIYTVPNTAGFTTGVERVHHKIEKRSKKNDPITMKPFVVLASRSDDTLDAEAIRTLIDAVGTARMEIELRDNSHDIFLSREKKRCESCRGLCKCMDGTEWF